MKMNPNYAKTQLRDENGVILLPQSTASMISEEPDRRFVDNVEKTLLHSLADNKVALEILSQHHTDLALLAENTEVLLPESEVQIALQQIIANIDSLARLTEHLEGLIAIANGVIEIPSSTSDRSYTISIDDSSGTPELTLTEILPEEE